MLWKQNYLLRKYDNRNVVDEYLKGNERSFKYLMGQVMKESKGSVNPKVANDLLLEKLSKNS